MLGEARNEKISTGACHPPPTPRFQFGGSLQNLFPDISTIFRHGQHNFGSSTNLRSSQFVKKNSWRKWSQSFSLKKSSAFVLLSPSSPQSSSCYCMIPRFIMSPHIPHGTQGKFAKHPSYRHQSLGDNTRRHNSDGLEKACQKGRALRKIEAWRPDISIVACTISKGV